MKRLLITMFYSLLCTVSYAASPQSNGLYPLEFRNYLGNIENIHPKVLFFEDGWHGYKFWMAYTPYPLGSISAENPCIAVSNDGTNWAVPDCLDNPLAFAPDGGYNSDTHLVYNAETDELECWYRAFDIESVTDYILRRVSSDGVGWGAPEVVMPAAESGRMRLSPCVWIEDGRYRMVYSNGCALCATEASPDDWLWSQPVYLNVPTSLFIWHQDVLVDPDSGAVEILFTAYDQNGNNNAADLYYSHADSLFGEFCLPEMIIQRSPDPMAFDHRAIYRASMVKVRGDYYVYYSCIDRYWHRYMMLSVGSSIQDIVGFKQVTPMRAPAAGTNVRVLGRRVYNIGNEPMQIIDLAGRVVATSADTSAGFIYVPVSGVYVVATESEAVTIVVN